jgi:hypothetical protein
VHEKATHVDFLVGQVKKAFFTFHRYYVIHVCLRIDVTVITMIVEQNNSEKTNDKEIT